MSKKVDSDALVKKILAQDKKEKSKKAKAKQNTKSSKKKYRTPYGEVYAMRVKYADNPAGLAAARQKYLKNIK